MRIWILKMANLKAKNLTTIIIKIGYDLYIYWDQSVHSSVDN